MIVVDAAVVCKWLVDEDEETTRPARVLREQYVSRKEHVLAPDILLYEIANIFAYKSGFTREDIAKAWQSFLILDIPLVNPTHKSMHECLVFAQKYHVSVYDAAYVVLAQEKKCICVTTDEKLIARVKLPFVRSIKDYQP